MRPPRSRRTCTRETWNTRFACVNRTPVGILSASVGKINKKTKQYYSRSLHSSQDNPLFIIAAINLLSKVRERSRFGHSTQRTFTSGCLAPTRTKDYEIIIAFLPDATVNPHHFSCRRGAGSSGDFLLAIFLSSFFARKRRKYQLTYHFPRVHKNKVYTVYPQRHVPRDRPIIKICSRGKYYKREVMTTSRETIYSPYTV